MRNIYDIMKSIGVEIPEDKKADVDKALLENYKTIAEVEGIRKNLAKIESERDSYKIKYDEDIKKRDEDLTALRTQLEDAGVDKTKLNELTVKFNSLQTSYDEAKTNYEKQLAQQKYEYLVKDCVNTLKFSSNSAKKTFLSDVINKNLPVENDTLLGFDDFVSAYKEQDAGAFLIENADNNPAKPKPQFASKSNNMEGQTGLGAEGGTNITEPIDPAVIW